MKTAIYIEDDTVQLVLTPQNKFDKDAIKSISGRELSVKTFYGSFYDCRGGWIRQSDYTHHSGFPGQAKDDNSLMIRVDDVEEEKVDEDIESNFKIIEVSELTVESTFGNWPDSIRVQNKAENNIAKYKIS